MKSLQLSKPHLLVVVGIPGAGKSFFASQFSDTFNAPYVDFGQFRRVAGDFKLGTQLANYTLGQLLKTNSTVIVEGRGATRADRLELEKAVQKYSYNVLYIWVQTDSESSEHRAVHSKTATLLQDDYDRQVKEFESLDRSKPHVVISGKHTYASQARVVLKKLTAARESASIPVMTRQVPRNRTI